MEPSDLKPYASRSGALRRNRSETADSGRPAIYAGLRRGELQALTWNDIDLEQCLIHVNQSWDRKAGLIEPKSRSGKRRVPVTKHLRQLLIAHRLNQGTWGRRLRLHKPTRRPLRSSHHSHPCPQGLENRRPHTTHTPRLQTHLRNTRHRRRRQRQSPQHLPRPLNNYNHPRPLRTPPARQRTTRRGPTRHASLKIRDHSLARSPEAKTFVVVA
jgi:integrase